MVCCGSQNIADPVYCGQRVGAWGKEQLKESQSDADRAALELFLFVVVETHKHNPKYRLTYQSTFYFSFGHIFSSIIWCNVVLTKQ